MERAIPTLSEPGFRPDSGVQDGPLEPLHPLHPQVRGLISMERFRSMIHTRSTSRSMIGRQEMETLRKVVWVVAACCAAMLWFSHDKLTGVQTIWALGLIVFAFGWYAGSCWWWPFGACFCCGGKGTHFRKDGKVHRVCRKRFCSWHSPFASCGGKGRRLRWGRRFSNFIRTKTAGAKAKEKTA